MTIIPLSEGLFVVDAVKRFAPFVQGMPRIPGTTLLAIRPFLIRMEKELILLDTGLGRVEDGQPALLRSLADAGVYPEQITRVILSHLHKDHTGGTGIWEEEHFRPLFPKATHYVQRREWLYARAQTGNPSYHEPTLLALEALPDLVWLEADAGEIDEGISYAVSGGHTPFHQTIRLEEDGETVFYAADEIPMAVYLDQNSAYKNDFDGRIARENRREWKEQAMAEGRTFLFYHDRRLPFKALP